MKIDNSLKTQTPGALSVEAQGKAKKTSDTSSSPVDTNVNLSSVSSHMQAIEQGFADTPVVNVARVAALKQAISDGHFKVDAGKVADRLISSVREMLNSHKA